MASPCAANPDQWFSDQPEDIEAAKAGCAKCPLTTFNVCREDGFSHEFGTFGGLTEQEREASNPDGYAALVATAKGVSDATDIEIVANGKLSKLAPDLNAEDLRAASAIIVNANSRQSAGVALVALGMSAPQVASYYGVDRDSVVRWGTNARRKARAKAA